GFLAPLMFAGLAAVSIPVILHFFFRSRYRKVQWAAMEFLLTSVQQTSRRLKFQEILLLLTRMALIALLAFALTRPAFTVGKGSSGQAEAVDAVLVIDNSYSMGARDGSMIRLERAKLAAKSVVAALPPQSTVQVIVGADTAEYLGPRTPSNLDQAKQLIDGIELTSQATDFQPLMLETLDALKRTHAPNREVYFFSDMQKLGWQQQ